MQLNFFFIYFSYALLKIFYWLINSIVIKFFKSLKCHQELRRCPLKKGLILRTEVKFRTSQRIVLKCLVEFENFSGTTIFHTIEFGIDRRLEDQFLEGQKIDLRVNSDLDAIIWVHPDLSRARLNKLAIFIQFSLPALYLYGFLQLITWIWNEKQDQLQTEVDSTILTTIVIFYLILFFMKFLLRPALTEKAKEALIRFGLRSTADIMNVEESGTKIDGKPLVNLDIKFIDSWGDVIEHQTQQLCTNSELAEVKATPTREIFYLKNNPKICYLADQLHKEIPSAEAVTKILEITFILGVTSFELFRFELVNP